MRTLNLRGTAEALNTINTSRSNAASGLTDAIVALFRAVECYERAWHASTRLDAEGALTGPRSDELKELCGDLDVQRTVCAEMAHVLARWLPDRIPHEAELSATATRAHEGMQIKCLGALEAECLREAVVTGLSGEATT
jgi:hypothetical protein